jgi:hypothetical protein
MTWQKWTLIALYVYATLSTIARIGKKREPITPSIAVVTTVLAVGFIALVVTA